MSGTIHRERRGLARRNARRRSVRANVFIMATFESRSTPAEDRFWRIHQGIRTDVGAAVKSNRTYLSIYNLKAADPDIQAKISRFPEFWTTVLYSVQTTFFISFGRLFDSRRDSLSVKVVEMTIQNPQIFSKPALLGRKRFDCRIVGDDPEWLIDYINKAWEPNHDDLESLLTALAPHCDKFKRVYAPIRHEIYAHRSKKDEEEVYTHFGKTIIGDVEHILRFVHTLLISLQEMVLNGRKPDLTDFTDYDAYVRNLDAEIEGFLRQLT